MMITDCTVPYVNRFAPPAVRSPHSPCSPPPGSVAWTVPMNVGVQSCLIGEELGSRDEMQAVRHSVSQSV